MSVKRILVIDDKKDFCTIIQVCLENLGGWTVLTASSGSEGLSLAQNQQPDAILLDVMMPDMDGFALFQALQNHPATQAIPVVLLTAKVQASDLAQFAQLGVAGVISKPFDPLTLAQQVAATLGWQS